MNKKNEKGKRGMEVHKKKIGGGEANEEINGKYKYLRS